MGIERNGSCFIYIWKFVREKKHFLYRRAFPHDLFIRNHILKLFFDSCVCVRERERFLVIFIMWSCHCKFCYSYWSRTWSKKLNLFMHRRSELLIELILLMWKHNVDYPFIILSTLLSISVGFFCFLVFLNRLKH